jgi:hypothetical protein
MAYTYEVITNDQQSKVIKRTDDEGVETWIPFDDANADYQAYLNKDNPDYGKPTEL